MKLALILLSLTAGTWAAISTFELMMNATQVMERGIDGKA